MRELSQSLFDLYRACRECPPEEFRNAAMRQVRMHLDFASGMWGDGRIAAESVVIPSMVHTVDLDPGFAVEWARRNHKDPVVARVTRQMGTVARVDVGKTYANVPESVEAGRRYDIRSFAVIAVPGAGKGSIQWLCLYQPERELLATESQLLWLSHFAPHMAEAFRINQLLHQGPHPWSSDEGLAVVEASTARLIRADDTFLKGARNEWPSFDGWDLPIVIRRLWDENPNFDFHGRCIRLDGHRSGGLVYLRARKVTGPGRLTKRQLEIARLYIEGLATKEIARRLNISHATVRNHVAMACEALGAHGKLDMAVRVRAMLA